LNTFEIFDLYVLFRPLPLALHCGRIADHGVSSPPQMLLIPSLSFHCDLFVWTVTNVSNSMNHTSLER